MPVCEFCERKFKTRVEEGIFADELPSLSYENLAQTLCAACAIEAIEYNPTEDVYFDNCECCGKRFDMIEEDYEYINGAERMRVIGADKIRYTYDETLCAECALERLYNELPDDDDDEYEENGLSLEDAALIYASNGCDEDYTYGYSEDELEDYLK